MNNEEMFLTILNRMDSMETGFNGLNARMDKLETSLNGRMDKLDSRMDKLDSRIDKLESNMNMEFYAVRKEMDVLNKTLKKEINALSSKVDKLMFAKDVEEYDKVNIRLEVLERGYQELKEKII